MEITEDLPASIRELMVAKVQYRYRLFHRGPEIIEDLIQFLYIICTSHKATFCVYCYCEPRQCFFCHSQNYNYQMPALIMIHYFLYIQQSKTIIILD